MKCRYSSLRALHRIGSNPVLRIEIEMDFKEDFRENYPLLVLDPRFKVELHEVSRDLRSRGLRGLIDDIIGGSIFIQNPATDTTGIPVDMPVTQTLINTMNEIRRSGKLPALGILVECDCVYYEHGSRPVRRAFSTYVRKPIYGREEDLVIFTTDEVDLLMKDLKYIEFLRVEVPLPLKAEHIAQEKLVKSVNEIMVAKDLLMKGKHDRVLHTCRNVIMNYLTTREARNELVEEIRSYILSKVPEGQKSVYEEALKCLGTTVYGVLQHLHKFIKEDTGKLYENPLRADAEYAFYTLFSIVKYLTELSVER